jgi:hypothetical protein
MAKPRSPQGFAASAISILDSFTRAPEGVAFLEQLVVLHAR